MKIWKADSELEFVDTKFTLPADCLVFGPKDKVRYSGSITCSRHNFFYSFGEPAYFAPLTLKEEFILAFKGNYHAKFFEKIHIDPKVYRLFIDSVAVLGVERKTVNSEKMLLNCSVCNMEAKLLFRGNVYYYPYYINTISDISNSYLIESDTIRGYVRKLWFSLSDTLPSGLLLNPLNKKEADKSLMIITNKEKCTPEVKKLLYKIISNN